MLFKSLALAAFAAVAAAQDAATPDLATLLANTTELSNLTSIVSGIPGLTEQLGAATNVTILAPNNAAFATFMNESEFANDTDYINALLTYHILQGEYQTFNESTFVPTLLQPGAYANVTGGQVVHVNVDGEDISFFSGLLQNASVVNSTNFTGGVVHIIDTVLTIPYNLSVTAIEANLSSAAGALTNLNLIDTLQGLTDITVFVPDNEAFQAIGSTLANASVEDLTSILQYHVVESVAYSTSLENTTLTTLQGNNITITVADDGVFVNGAKVTVPDVLISNGVVHVIDNVLNPDNSTTTNNTSSDEGSPAFSGASSVTDVPFTSGVPAPTGNGGAGGAATSEAPGATSSGAAQPMKTGAIGAAALFGGAAMVLNL